MGLRNWLNLPERETSTEIVPKRSMTLDQYLAMLQSFTFNGVSYPLMPTTTLQGRPQEEPEPTFEGYVQGAYKANGVVFACMVARQLLFSEARFQWRQLRSGRPGDLFGSRELAILERPWPNGTTGDLLARAIQDADLAGNFYAVRSRGTIKRLRPDWVTIVLGSELNPEEPGFSLDCEVAGYIYKPGGVRGSSPPQILFPEEVAHFAPIPDPTARFRGMSWLTPVIREVMADQAATQHKLTYFENGATPNLAVTLDASVGFDAFKEFEEEFYLRHGDLNDFYKTMIFGGGAKVDIVGSDFRQLDFKSTQGGGETRICAAARVPPIIVGVSEGLDSATYSNYGQARRAFADLTMRPLWRNIAASLETIVDPPTDRNGAEIGGGSELWYDDRDIPFLQEDVLDAADILETQSRAIRNLTDGGYTPESVVDAVVAGDLRRLDHTGLLSVQMQKPGSSSNGNGASSSQEVERRVAELERVERNRRRERR